MTLELDLKYSKTKLYAKFLLNMSKRVREKCGKLCIFSNLHSKRGITPKKNWRKLMKLELDLKYSKTKSYAKFQLNMSKRVREKCGKLCIFSILSSKRDITPTKIDGNRRHSNLICSTLKKSLMQNFSSICQSMQEKSAKTAHYLYSKFTKRNNSLENWRKVTTLKLDL